MGGDEFCVPRATAADVAGFGALCAGALAADDDRFAISAAYGVVALPEERTKASIALALADKRMYRTRACGGPRENMVVTIRSGRPDPAGSLGGEAYQLGWRSAR